MVEVKGSYSLLRFFLLRTIVTREARRNLLLNQCLSLQYQVTHRLYDDVRHKYGGSVFCWNSVMNPLNQNKYADWYGQLYMYTCTETYCVGMCRFLRRSNLKEVFYYSKNSRQNWVSWIERVTCTVAQFFCVFFRFHDFLIFASYHRHTWDLFKYGVDDHVHVAQRDNKRVRGRLYFGSRLSNRHSHC